MSCVTARFILVPFDGFIDKGDRYVAETHTVIYEPSATSFYLLTSQKRRPSYIRACPIGGRRRSVQSRPN